MDFFANGDRIKFQPLARTLCGHFFRLYSVQKRVAGCSASRALFKPVVYNITAAWIFCGTRGSAQQDLQRLICHCCECCSGDAAHKTPSRNASVPFLPFKRFDTTGQAYTPTCPGPSPGFNFLLGKQLAHIPEGLEFQCVTTGVKQKHGGLFTNLTFEANTRFYHKLGIARSQALR